MISVAFGRIDVKDGAFVVVDEVNGERMHIPVGSFACIMLEPGTRISHEAVKLAASVGTLLIWVGEGGVRLYSTGQPGGARSDRLLYQAKLALDDELRLKVVRKMFEIRFGEPAPQRRSINQLRGIEGARVREKYKALADEFGVEWQGRKYDVKNWQESDIPNKCISAATACLYGIVEAPVLAAGYAPAIGFLHSGKPLSFVYDVADLFKFETVIPAAFKVASQGSAKSIERKVRLECRDAFRQEHLLKRIIPLIEIVLAAGGISEPSEPDYVQPPAIAEPENFGDVGHRSR